MTKRATLPTAEPPWLPFTTKAKRLETAWAEYRKARALHLAEHPDYDLGWGRPTQATAEQIWNLVAPVLGLRIADLLPSHRFLSIQDDLELAPQMMQALVVVLDSIIGLVPRDEEDEGEDGVSFYQNGTFDAIAARWSDHYRRAREITAARFSTQMTRETLAGAWKDLQLVGIDVAKIWKAVRSDVPGLYRVSRKGRQYRIDVDYESPLYADFRRIVGQDPHYRPNRRGRLFLADEERAVEHGSRKVAAEWAYNVVEPGPRGLNVIRILEETHLLVSLDEVVTASNDERLSSAERCSLALVAADIKASGRVDVDGNVKHKTGYYELVNGRWQPAHFWPTEVTGKSAPTEVVSEGLQVDASFRGRMFKVAAKSDDVSPWEYLVGSDVRGSQWQIEAELLDIPELRAMLATESLKKTVARIAWDQENGFALPKIPGVPDFRGADDTRLVSAAKKATTAIGYGGSYPEAARALGWQDESGRGLRRKKLNKARERYGPGLGSPENIERLLHDPRLHLEEVLDQFLPAMEQLAKIAHRDRYAGVVLTNPFDMARVRWNPIAFRDEAYGQLYRSAQPGSRGRWKAVRLPEDQWTTVQKTVQGKVKTRTIKSRKMWQRTRWPSVGSGAFRPSYKPPKGEPNEEGDYPVDRAALTRMVAPCLVHMLDAAYCGLVVENLAAQGVQDIVAINDSWAVGLSDAKKLNRAIQESGRPWFEMLGPVFDDWERYLGDDKKFGPMVREWRARWARRVEKDWPTFGTEDAELMALRILDEEIPKLVNRLATVRRAIAGVSTDEVKPVTMRMILDADAQLERIRAMRRALAGATHERAPEEDAVAVASIGS